MIKAYEFAINWDSFMLGSLFTIVAILAVVGGFYILRDWLKVLY